MWILFAAGTLALRRSRDLADGDAVPEAQNIHDAADQPVRRAKADLDRELLTTKELTRAFR
jgi:hypothetical protein